MIGSQQFALVDINASQQELPWLQHKYVFLCCHCWFSTIVYGSSLDACLCSNLCLSVCLSATALR